RRLVARDETSNAAKSKQRIVCDFMLRKPMKLTFSWTQSEEIPDLGTSLDGRIAQEQPYSPPLHQLHGFDDAGRGGSYVRNTTPPVSGWGCGADIGGHAEWVTAGFGQRRELHEQRPRSSPVRQRPSDIQVRAREVAGQSHRRKLWKRGDRY